MKKKYIAPATSIQSLLGQSIICASPVLLHFTPGDTLTDDVVD